MCAVAPNRFYLSGHVFCCVVILFCDLVHGLVTLFSTITYASTSKNFSETRVMPGKLFLKKRFSKDIVISRYHQDNMSV